MKKLIIIKYGELSTKKDNINYFLITLKKNVINILKGIDCRVIFDKSRMFVETEEFDLCLEKLKKVFGIHEINIAYEMDNNIEIIKSNLIELIRDIYFNTFKVETKRSYKKYPIESLEISKILGGVILKNKENIKVDVHSPEIIFNIEIRSNKAYIYFEKVKGLGGYPVGVQGKSLLMLSGGIDSPVAGYLAMKRGIKLEAVYFEAPPHTSLEAKNKVVSLARKLSEYNNLSIKLHVINFTEIEENIYKNIPNDYLITIMRRMMYRICAILCSRNNDKAIINGESIGQVASQTLSSMKCINSVIDTPVIRPVACFDKLEIMDLARKIDTYETSILPYEDCCTIFVPKHPVINPNIKTCEEYEKLIDYKDMIFRAVKNHEVIMVDYKEENKFQDLL